MGISRRAPRWPTPVHREGSFAARLKACPDTKRAESQDAETASERWSTRVARTLLSAHLIPLMGRRASRGCASRIFRTWERRKVSPLYLYVCRNSKRGHVPGQPANFRPGGTAACPSSRDSRDLGRAEHSRYTPPHPVSWNQRSTNKFC